MISYERLNLFIRVSSDSSPYATLRKSQVSPNAKQRVNSSAMSVPISSYRLPPPLSSPIINSLSTRTRSLENINDNEQKLSPHQVHRHLSLYRILSYSPFLVRTGFFSIFNSD